MAQAGCTWRPCPLTNQDGRVVKALDLSSNGQMSAWVRTPLLVKVLRCRSPVLATVARLTNPCDTATSSSSSRGHFVAPCCSSSVLGGRPIYMYAYNTSGPFCGFRSSRVLSIDPACRCCLVPSLWTSIPQTIWRSIELPVCTAIEGRKLALEKARRTSWTPRFRGVMVSTQDSESCDPSSNLGGTCESFFTTLAFPAAGT